MGLRTAFRYTISISVTLFTYWYAVKNLLMAVTPGANPFGLASLGLTIYGTSSLLLTLAWVCWFKKTWIFRHFA